MTKYLNTRDGSIEDATVKTFEKNITFEKKEIKLEAPKNRYLNTRDTSLEAAVTKVVTEGYEGYGMKKKMEDSDYQKMFKKELEKTGKSLAQMSDAEKKAFFNKIDSKHTSKNEDVNESASQVQVKRDGKGNFNLMFRGKEIGYYHKSGSKYMVYYDNEDGDYNQSDEVSSEMQAKKLAYDNMNEKVDNPYAVGMAAAMKKTGDKPPLKKSTITKAHDIAKSIEKDEKKEGYEGKSYKSYKDMKKEAEMAKNKKTTMTDKPVTPIDVAPKTDSQAGYATTRKM